jgi:DeoR/GlpR family transcriptional regulator of sugar metabolism
MVLSIRLHDIFDLSRRELAQLYRAGQLTRDYGGAVLPSKIRYIGHADRMKLSTEVKSGIASPVAYRIPDGAPVILVIGSILASAPAGATGQR